MKQRFFKVFPVICLLCFSVLGQNYSKKGAAVIKTLQDICSAYETKDTSVLLEYMTADFTLTASDGSITTRDDEIGIAGERGNGG